MLGGACGCVCWGGGSCVRMCKWKPKNNLLCPLEECCLDRVSLLLVAYRARQAPATPDVFIWVLGTKRRSSCLYGKCFTHWAIGPAQPGFCGFLLLHSHTAVSLKMPRGLLNVETLPYATYACYLDLGQLAVFCLLKYFSRIFKFESNVLVPFSGIVFTFGTCVEVNINRKWLILKYEGFMSFWMEFFFYSFQTWILIIGSWEIIHGRNLKRNWIFFLWLISLHFS